MGALETKIEDFLFSTEKKEYEDDYTCNDEDEEEEEETDLFPDDDKDHSSSLRNTSGTQ